MRNPGPATDIAYAGVTPYRVFDTLTKQNTRTSSGAGICSAMTSDWIAKNTQVGRVTSSNQLKPAHLVAIAQAAHEIGHNQDREDLFESFGLSKSICGTSKGKWYQQKKTKFQNVATSVCWGGYFYIALRGDGGHAVGVHFQGQRREFFDPNEGLLTFGSVQEFIKWFPAYIVGDYPNLTKECIVYKVK